MKSASRNDLAPYEIHVDPGQYGLYWTLPKNTAIRYSVGIGRTDLYEAGEFYVGARKVWPSWTPTPEMIERDPDSYAQFADGMPGGLNNPLGSRGLYLFPARSGRHIPADSRDQRSQNHWSPGIKWMRASDQ